MLCASKHEFTHKPCLPDCKPTRLFFIPSDRKSCTLQASVGGSFVGTEERDALQEKCVQESVCECQTQRTSLRVRFIRRKHTLSCSCSPNCSSAETSGRPLCDHTRSTARTALLLLAHFTHTTGGLFTAISHILLTQSIVVAEI